MTSTYWEIGRRIVEHEQEGRRRAGYGEALIERLAADLTARFRRGFSQTNLKQMREFYLWPGRFVRQCLTNPERHDCAECLPKNARHRLTNRERVRPREISRHDWKGMSHSKIMPPRDFLFHGPTMFACSRLTIRKRGPFTNAKLYVAAGPHANWIARFRPCFTNGLRSREIRRPCCARGRASGRRTRSLRRKK